MPCVKEGESMAFYETELEACLGKTGRRRGAPRGDVGLASLYSFYQQVAKTDFTWVPR
jgi:hypothetical protein